MYILIQIKQEHNIVKKHQRNMIRSDLALGPGLSLLQKTKKKEEGDGKKLHIGIYRVK